MKEHFGCPVQATANTIKGKWKVPIVWHLSLGSRRFTEFREVLPGISEKVLTSQLRALEKDGIVKRLDANSMPPRVDYMLTRAGEQLIPVMEEMCRWAGEHLGMQPNLPQRVRASAVSGAVASAEHTHR